ncbi:glycosyltransferase family 2 protein [Enterovibrio sp. ZSDZ42]|uniref:Glycosyltransferase family 2 protein n=1 Tax=Enterovibrio gelatinilyticus TaxID=2899819 RepID=A0ABT5QV33_9GAMM|nr:glycosyltransferase family 2 protein [Enterovibrio sp. ZSDZ42]MDD1791873.1 glycosyltransferase family 2 protein [Enterovibrio sp. ZSDZ42]
MSAYSPCFLIPCYNHGATIGAVVEALRDFSLPVLIVDDGSDEQTKQQLSVVAQSPHVYLHTLTENQGKGGAVMAGFRKATELGFSHALQIDADGQHDLTAVPSLIAASTANPASLISGRPIYDESVPKSRLYGRYITHFWVMLETLSTTIKDSMCGFRAYPLVQTLAVIDQSSPGKRMDFDIEIMVRMYWEAIDVRFIDIRVIYPEGGISHFDALRDNMRISKMHTLLFFSMLPKIPHLLAMKRQNKQHWSARKERGTILGIKILLGIYRLLGRKAFSLLLRPVMAYYWLTGKAAREASKDYLSKLEAFSTQYGHPIPPNLSTYRHLVSFGETMLDKLAAWQGDFNESHLTISGAEHFQHLAAEKRGAILIGSHLGNIELCRALSRRHTHIKINALVFTEHAEQFNSVMDEVNANSSVNLITVSHLGPDTAIMLQQKIDDGEWVVIVGDRTSVTREGRVVMADFLGEPAPFPQGPFILAAVLKAPVFLLFGIRDENSNDPHFNVYFEPFYDPILLPRGKREDALQKVVAHYASRLEHHTLKAPLQWYNFFNFWQLTSNDNDIQR